MPERFCHKCIDAVGMGFERLKCDEGVERPEVVESDFLIDMVLYVYIKFAAPYAVDLLGLHRGRFGHFP